MLISVLEMATIRKLSFVVFILCLLISFKYPNAGSNSTFRFPSSSDSDFVDKPDVFFSSSSSGEVDQNEDDVGSTRSLEYDYYRESCPKGEKTVREMVQFLYTVRPSMAPVLLRLIFHDCFIEGCDASVLLDVAEGIESEKDSPPNETLKGFDIIDLIKSELEELCPGVVSCADILVLAAREAVLLGCDASVLLDVAEGIESEKDSPPNETLKGFDIIDLIKSELEELCPGVVSCADILVLAAREAVLLAGGPFYPLYTGRRDSTVAFSYKATFELPSPHDDLSETLASFSSRGSAKLPYILHQNIGAHSVGVIHCHFFHNRLYNFAGTNQPDPSLDSRFLEEMRSMCNRTHTSSSSAPFSGPSPSFSGSPSSPAAPSPSFSGSPSSSFGDLLQQEEAGVDMAYEGPGSTIGMLYYRSLMQGKGILYADQQLTAGEETGIWVRAYASDNNLFRRDFALAMMKLSNLQVLTAPMGQVRLNCSMVA